MNLLLLDRRPVAFVYNYVYDGWIYGLRKGFDPEFAAFRPGLVLEKMMVEDGFRRGDRCVRLGRRLAGDQAAVADRRGHQLPLHAFPRGDFPRADCCG